MGPAAYAISRFKQILQRNLTDFFSKEKFAFSKKETPLPITVSSHISNMIKRGPGIDPQLQYNKADNIRLACSKLNNLIIRPGETFSFWKIVGKSSKKNGFSEGRVIVNGKLVSGTGGGLCNLANTLHLLFMHSPMTITELHHHSDALAPDPEGKRIPYSAGTSVNYNYIDLRFRNDTDQPVQLITYCENEDLCAELRTTKEFPYRYRIVEEGHHFHMENNGKYYRVSKIYRETIDSKSNTVIKKELKWDNHSQVMFDYNLIPPDQIS